jgi:hypothetical protein
MPQPNPNQVFTPGRVGCLAVIAAIVATGIVGYVLSLIPFGGVITLVVSVALWVIVLVGGVWKASPPWMRSLRAPLVAKLKWSLAATALVVLAGGVAIARQAQEAQKQDLVDQENAIKTDQRARAEARAAKRRAAAAQEAQARDAELTAAFRVQKDTLSKKLEDASRVVAGDDLDAAVAAVRNIKTELDVFSNSSASKSPEYGALTRRLGEQRQGLGALVERRKEPLEAHLTEVDRLLEGRKVSAAWDALTRLDANFKPIVDIAEGAAVDSLKAWAKAARQRADIFDQKVLDYYFEVLWADGNEKTSKEAIEAQVARRFKIERKDVVGVYERHDDEASQRLQQHGAETEAEAKAVAEAAKREARKQGWYVTKGGYIAATTSEMLDRAIGFRELDDSVALAKLIQSGTVFFLKPNVFVALEETKEAMVKIRPKGAVTGVWTVIEGIEN